MALLSANDHLTENYVQLQIMDEARILSGLVRF